VQLAYIRNYPETTRNFLKIIVFGNELSIAHIHVLFHAAKPLWEMTMSLGFSTPIVTKGEFPAVAVFLHYLLHGTSDEKVFAMTLITNAAQTNRYCKNSLIALAGMEETIDEELSPSLWIHNHIPSFGPEVVVRRTQFPELDGNQDGTVMKPDDTLHCPSNAVIWLEVHGEDAPFDVTGHYPILAGYTSELVDGTSRELYVAMVYPQPFSVCYAYVEDGARAVEYVDDDHGGRRRKTSMFYVMVLRHNLLDVEVPRRAGYGLLESSAIFLQTGPVYWEREPDGTSTSTGTGGQGQRLRLLDSFEQPVKFYDSEANDGDAPRGDEFDAGVNRNRWVRDDGRVADKSFDHQVEEIRRILSATPPDTYM